MIPPRKVLLHLQFRDQITVLRTIGSAPSSAQRLNEANISSSINAPLGHEMLSGTN
jgi:hypothetical protein